jgi:multidrug efflux pump subunit AcrA (membrane-fusion protein)
MATGRSRRDRAEPSRGRLEREIMSDDLQQKMYPEDERLHRVRDDPDRRMTRDEWEREESLARQAAHKRHTDVGHDREVQQEYDRKQRSKRRDWKKIFFWVGVGLFVLLLIFLLGYLPRHARAKKAATLAEQREHEEPEVEVVQVKRSHAPGQLTVPGTTSPITEAYIYARANGYLRKRFVDIGDHVKKGQLLALIDAPDLDAQVDQAREQLRQAESQVSQQQAQLALNKVTWDRWRTLVAKGVFSRQDGDQREADYLAQAAVVASAQRNVESYRANLRRAIALQGYERVAAPFDGVITQRNSDVGALVGSSGAAASMPMQGSQTPSGGSANVGSSNTSGSSGTANQSAAPATDQAQGGALFGIAQLDKLRILVSVPEGYASSIRTGMPAQIFVQERAGKPISGTVARASGSVDQNSRTMLTEIDVENRNGSLFPGMYAVVTFVQVRGVPPLTVPGDAIVVRNDQTTIATVRDQKIQLVPVEIGRDYGPTVEILGGLREGDWVVSTVTDDVRQGVRVRPHVSSESGQGGAQTNKAPDSGPNQYGDQSIVNSKTESTSQKGKQGQKSGGPVGDKPDGGQQKQGKQAQKGASK